MEVLGTTAVLAAANTSRKLIENNQKLSARAPPPARAGRRASVRVPRFRLVRARCERQPVGGRCLTDRSAPLVLPVAGSDHAVTVVSPV